MPLPESTSNDVAAVIVAYQSAGVIGRAIDSCLKAGIEVIVVDNASTDGTAAEVQKRPVTLLANKENRGFAGGVNQGIQATDKPFILLLNPDAALVSGIGDLLKVCREPGVGAAAGKLIDSHGMFQKGFSVRRFPTPATLAYEVLGINRLWPRNRLNARYRYFDLMAATPGAVEQPAAAFLMIRRDVWKALSGFDERFYPVWFEDVDYCRRLANSGWKVIFIPTAAAVHEGGHSARQLLSESRELYWYGSLLEYAAKHYPRRAHASVALAVALGGALRLLMGILGCSSLRPIAVYARVIRLAYRSVLLGSRSGKRNDSGTGTTNRTEMHVI